MLGGFRVSEGMDSEGIWTMLPAFSNVKLPTAATAQLTDAALSDIREIIKTQGIAPDAEGTTDSRGQVVYGNLPAGVYFGRVTKGPDYLTVQDFLVSVPQKQDGKWEYTAKAELKYDYTTPSPSPSPTPSPTPKPTPTPTPVPPPGGPTPTPVATMVKPTPAPWATPTPTPKPYHLVIHYIYAETGETAWPDHSDTLWDGEAYLVLSPIIPEYQYDIAEVAGIMPAHNVEYTVMYFAKKPGWSYYNIEDYETALGIGDIQMHVGVCFE